MAKFKQTYINEVKSIVEIDKTEPILNEKLISVIDYIDSLVIEYATKLHLKMKYSLHKEIKVRGYWEALIIL